LVMHLLVALPVMTVTHLFFAVVTTVHSRRIQAE
jgi:hypothetical protein